MLLKILNFEAHLSIFPLTEIFSYLAPAFPWLNKRKISKEKEIRCDGGAKIERSESHARWEKVLNTTPFESIAQEAV